MHGEAPPPFDGEEAGLTTKTTQMMIYIYTYGCDWRVGVSQPRRVNRPIFLYIYICDSHCTYRNAICEF